MSEPEDLDPCIHFYGRQVQTVSNVNHSEIVACRTLVATFSEDLAKLTNHRRWKQEVLYCTWIMYRRSCS